jgi:hypothetical protein
MIRFFLQALRLDFSHTTSMQALVRIRSILSSAITVHDASALQHINCTLARRFLVPQHSGCNCNSAVTRTPHQQLEVAPVSLTTYGCSTPRETTATVAVSTTASAVLHLIEQSRGVTLHL